MWTGTRRWWTVSMDGKLGWELLGVHHSAVPSTAAFGRLPWVGEGAKPAAQAKGTQLGQNLLLNLLLRQGSASEQQEPPGQNQGWSAQRGWRELVEQARPHYHLSALPHPWFRG